MKYSLALITSLLLAFSSFGQTIDSGVSTVEFSISNFKKEVSGTFKGMTGEVTFNPNNLSSSSIDVCIDPSTVNTENEKRDKHLKTEDFFHVEAYPTICFKSNEIKASGDQYIAKGQLTMHGITNDVEIQLNYSDKRLEGQFNVNRRDYKIGPKGKKMIGHVVTLKINCQLK